MAILLIIGIIALILWAIGLAFANPLGNPLMAMIGVILIIAWVLVSGHFAWHWY
jgi:hypothetical protein